MDSYKPPSVLESSPPQQKRTSFFRQGLVFIIGGVMAGTAILMTRVGVGGAITQTLSQPGDSLFRTVLPLCLYLLTFVWKIPRRLFLQPYQPTIIASFVSGAFLICWIVVGSSFTTEQQLENFINQYSGTALFLTAAMFAMIGVIVAVELERLLSKWTCKTQHNDAPSVALEPASFDNGSPTATTE
ncbi:hypothetical protein [Novipirellula sp.]|uniref:hypothetical protein n=1 Tax=Novipirellula sp. TaxID=2795430 RepID=UPI003566F178